jgi:hypothetical protein
MIVSILLSVVIVLLLIFPIRLLLRKQEIAEDVIVNYMNYLDQLSKVIELSNIKLNEIDHKGTFKSDDEIGFFFTNIKEIQSILNEFNILTVKE